MVIKFSFESFTFVIIVSNFKVGRHRSAHKELSSLTQIIDIIISRTVKPSKNLNLWVHIYSARAKRIAKVCCHHMDADWLSIMFNIEFSMLLLLNCNRFEFHKRAKRKSLEKSLLKNSLLFGEIRTAEIEEFLHGNWFLRSFSIPRISLSQFHSEKLTTGYCEWKVSLVVAIIYPKQ